MNAWRRSRQRSVAGDGGPTYPTCPPTSPFYMANSHTHSSQSSHHSHEGEAKHTMGQQCK